MRFSSLHARDAFPADTKARMLVSLPSVRAFFYARASTIKQRPHTQTRLGQLFLVTAINYDFYFCQLRHSSANKSATPRQMKNIKSSIADVLSEK
ncbi:hypothetical protein JHL21_17135 [Devosia sp. WQ 349]|uniref:hypothetical protein n=1 Tax=Devosia sp. WQ 349K1 TaxID=2800329 RepID=UPI001906F2BB|nr:hypothetical protein [Devosia sp. WQ 349K1]MBK1796216.1 hypothetical protein [Devosia sp. WQ 349K1]